jgi:hypothetical protein
MTLDWDDVLITLFGVCLLPFALIIATSQGATASTALNSAGLVLSVLMLAAYVRHDTHCPVYHFTYPLLFAFIFIINLTALIVIVQ